MALTPTYCPPPPTPPTGPGLPSAFSPNIIPFIDGNSDWAESAVFTYQNGRLGVGNNNPQATVHITGNSDVTGKAFQVDSLTRNVLNITNVGNMELTSNSGNYGDIFKINGYGYLNVLYNIFKIGKSAGYPYLALNTYSGNELLTISNQVDILKLNVKHPGGSMISNIYGTMNFTVSGTNKSTVNDFLFDAGTANKYIAGGNSLIKVLGTISGTTSGINNILNIAPTINQTSGAGVNVFIDYNPTITSITGAHYGLLIRPDTMSGFGLDSTMPTAVVHLAGSTTARASLRIESGTAPTSPNDGDIWNDGTDLYVRLGGTTYKIKKEI